MARRFVPKKRIAGGAEKEEGIELEGVVKEVHANTRLEVETTEGLLVNAYVCGKMKQHRIKVLAGDKVTVVVSAYDFTQGRVVRRHRV